MSVAKGRGVPIRRAACAAALLVVVATTPSCSILLSGQDGPLIAHGEAFQSLTLVTEGVEKCSSPTTGPGGVPLVFSSSRDGNADIYLKQNPTGPALRKLTTHRAHDLTPALSPTGDAVAFASNRSGNYDIFVMRLDGGIAKMQVTDSAEQELWPAWSPDGRLIAYTRFSRIDRRAYIWVKDMETGANTQLGPGRDPSFSPDGNTILFEKASEGGERWYSLWTMRTNGSGLTSLVGGSDWGAIDASWSPDGRRIVFASAKGLSGETYLTTDTSPTSPERLLEQFRGNNIWVVNADGTGLMQLTTHEADDFQPAWSADGHIYFVSTRDRKERVWRFPFESTVRPGVAQ